MSAFEEARGLSSIEHSRPPIVSEQAVEAWRLRMRQAFAASLSSLGTSDHVLLQFEQQIRNVCKILAKTHGTPHLGNWQDPTDEFIYILLSRKTREQAYVKSFERLKAAGSWGEIAYMDEAKLATLIRGSGLEATKAHSISKGLKAICKRFGEPNLARGGDLTDEQLLTFLAGLPGVGRKSALCIMLYAFERPTLPVDAHCGRILARLGIFEQLGVNLAPMDHRQRQCALADLVPPDIRYALHVNLIAHGRAICPARSPRCYSCPLQQTCKTAHQGRKEFIEGAL